MVVETAKRLTELAKRILIAAGANQQNAETVADHLVSANLSGVDTHGLLHLAGYVAAINSGELLPAASPAIVKEGPTKALITGNWTFGQVAAKLAMEVAITKAEEHGVAVAGLVQSHHIGRLGYFVEMAAQRQMISLVWAGGYGEERPAAVPYGGRTPVLHTNPIAIGFPSGEESPMMLDYATTSISGVKVDNAQRQREKLPPGCIVDKAGNPSTDPNDFLQGGAHVSFGGHKGYALMMAAEFLGRIFTGTDAFVEGDRGGPILRHQGVTMIVLQADLFQPFAEYARRADEMQHRVRAVPPAAGFKEVLAPGDPENRTRAERQRDGIPISDDVWKSLVELAASLKIRVG